MDTRGPLRSLVSASVVALGCLLLRPGFVAAECSYVPPWPDITDAIPSARDIVVGDIVTDFDPAALGREPGSVTEAFRVTHVIRGHHGVGDLLDTEYLLPNWPWSKSFPEWEAFPSCSYLQAIPGERIAIAFDALQPAQDLTAQGEELMTWRQPATRYNAMGVVIGKITGEEPDRERERVTIDQLRRLAALPATDTQSAERDAGVRPAEPPLVPVAAAVAAALFVLVRPDRRRGQNMRGRGNT